MSKNTINRYIRIDGWIGDDKSCEWVRCDCVRYVYIELPERKNIQMGVEYEYGEVLSRTLRFKDQIECRQRMDEIECALCGKAYYGYKAETVAENE